ncbi:MAG: hypothetical protein WCB68_17825 [Pyrinomonadaceae bacterium]
MTAQEHNRMLGIFYAVYGSLRLVGLLFTVILVPFYVNMFARMPGGAADFPVGLIWTILIVTGILSLVFGAIDLTAAYGILKRKPWGKTMGIVASIPALLGVPLGTALGIYALWFFNGVGKSYYEKPQQQWMPQGELRDAGASANWSDYQSQRKSEYVPPREPPNWR